MTYVFEVETDKSKKDIAIVADTLADAEAELRAWGILFCGGVIFTLKEILGLNDAGLHYYQDPGARAV